MWVTSEQASENLEIEICLYQSHNGEKAYSFIKKNIGMCLEAYVTLLETHMTIF